MGSSESKAEQPKAETLQKMRTARGREACYQAKDEFYKCLESEEAKCDEVQRVYEEICPRSWRNYFQDGKRKEQIVASQLTGLSK